jgi:hypothetical protein
MVPAAGRSAEHDVEANGRRRVWVVRADFVITQAVLREEVIHAGVLVSVREVRDVVLFEIEHAC